MKRKVEFEPLGFTRSELYQLLNIIKSEVERYKNSKTPKYERAIKQLAIKIDNYLHKNEEAS